MHSQRWLIPKQSETIISLIICDVILLILMKWTRTPTRLSLSKTCLLKSCTNHVRKQNLDWRCDYDLVNINEDSWYPSARELPITPEMHERSEIGIVWTQLRTQQYDGVKRCHIHTELKQMDVATRQISEEQVWQRSTYVQSHRLGHLKVCATSFLFILILIETKPQHKKIARSKASTTSR
jgi:hypothetical protein